MDSSSLQESGSRSSKPPPPPNFNSPVDFPALQPPVLKPTSSAASPVLLIGSLPVQPVPPHAIPKAVAFQHISSATPRHPPPAAPVTTSAVLSTVPSAKQQQQRLPKESPNTSLQMATLLAAPNAHMAASAGISNAAPSTNIINKSKVVDAYSGNFDFKPLHKINGTPCLTFFEQDKKRLLSKIRYIVIVKFSHNRPKYVDFRVFLDSKNFDKGFKIVEFDKKHVFVEFESFNDFVKLWILRSIVIKGFKARLFRWDGDFNPRFESFMAPVWIHLPGLPLFMFDEEVVLSIGALFGKTIYIDPACLNKDKIGVLSFCVSMDVRKEVLKEFWVEFIGDGIIVTRFTQAVVYGDIPPFCTSCSHLGHTSKSCKILETGDLREKIKGKQPMQEDRGVNNVISTISVFKRLGVLGVSTVGKEIGGPSSSIGTILEEGEVEDVTKEEDFILAKKNSAGFAVGKPSLEPHISLCGHNGGKILGVLENRVNKLQNGSRFGPLAAVNDEEIAVENCVLQEKSAACVEKATLAKDISLVFQDEEGSPSYSESQVQILQNPEEIGAKLSMVCPETDLEKRVLQNSVADSIEEATLLADSSQLVHGGSEIPGGTESHVAILQDAEEIKAINTVGCPENSVEVGDLLQSAADFNETQTLTGHISPTRNNQGMILGDPEISLPDLQKDLSLDHIAAVSEEISSDEDGVSMSAVQTLNEHNSCSGGGTDLILGPTKSQEDHLQVQGEKQVSNMLVNQVYSSKMIITDPVTKEVIVLPPPPQSLCAPTPISAMEGMSKNERKKWKKKKRREAEQKGKSVVEPLSSSNASKDISVFDDLVYPVITVISEDEACTGTYIPRHSRLHPSYKERSSKFNSLDYLDLHEVWATKRKDTDTMGKGLFKTPYKAPTSLADEALLVTPSSSSIPKVVSSSATKDQTGEALQPVIYSKEELAAKIVEKLNLSKYEEMKIELHNVVQQQIDKLGKRCPWNDRAVNIIVDWYINAMIWNTPDKKPPKDYQDYLRSIKKDKIRKDMIEPASQVKRDYNLRSKIKTQRNDSSYTKFFKENFVPP